jgi:hypothetical protein
MSAAYKRFGGICAVIAGVVGFLYAIAFVVLQNDLLSALFLLLGGLASSAALVAVYQRLREAEASFALWGLLLVLAGAFGAAIHGGYDLANAIHPPAMAGVDLPSSIDPRGLLTFGVAGIGLLVLSWLIGRSRALPSGLGYLGYALAVLLIILYLGRLIILDARSPLIVAPALLTGFLLNPAWYIWLGVALLRGAAGARRAPALSPA